MELEDEHKGTNSYGGRQTNLEKYLSVNYVRIQMEKVYVRNGEEDVATLRM